MIHQLRRLILVVSCLLLGLPSVARAWVAMPSPMFPDGEAPVIVDPFCMSAYCGEVSRDGWHQRVRDAMDAWNAARTGFMFSEVVARYQNVPCGLYDGIAVILTDGEVCPDDPPMGGTGFIVLTRYGQAARVYVNIGVFQDMDYDITPLLIHELGHALGLGHPDAAGQNVAAIMNSDSSFENRSLETVQPDDIAGARALWGGPGPLVGRLENPRAGSHQSGLGVISGWVCDADTVAIEINGVPYPVPYGTARLDTADACGDVDTGFGLLFNWNLLGDGEHEVVAVVDGDELARATVTVTTVAGEYPTGLAGEYRLEDFPRPGASVVVRWEESLQNFVIVERTP